MIINKYPKSSLLAYLLFTLIGTNLFAQTPKPKTGTDYVLPFASNDQFRTWSIGVNGGFLSQYTIFLGNADFRTVQPQAGYGFTVTKQFVPAFAIDADFFAGTLQGKYSGLPTESNSAYSKFHTDVNVAGSVNANITIVNINWRRNDVFLKPYATIGAGLINYSPTLYDYTNKSIKSNTSSVLYLPVGAGLKIGLSRVLALDIHYEVDFVNSDKLDGFAYNNDNDKFSYTRIGLEFTLGKKSKPRMAAHNASPAMRDEYEFDINSLKNQVTTLNKKTDSIKVKNDALAAVVEKVNTDSDGDGVPDQYDKCPNTPAGTKVDGAGCPLPPAEIKYVYVTAEDKKVVEDAITTLEFDLMKSTIRPTSYPNLDRLANVLKSKGITLKLDGYTDNTGPDWRNIALSKSRALAIKNYLVKKGASAANITAEGHGQENPVASNETLEGRRQNRRVEFTLQNGVEKKN